MKIYIASKTIHAHSWQRLRSEGYPISCTWIDEAGKGQSPSFSDLWTRCIQEASECDVLIAYRQYGEVLKGTFIEIGAALASMKPVYLVGFDNSLSFIHHPRCKVRDDLMQTVLEVWDIRNSR